MAKDVRGSDRKEEAKRALDEEEDEDSTASEPSISEQSHLYHADDERTTTDTLQAKSGPINKDNQLTRNTKKTTKCDVCDNIYNDKDRKVITNKDKAICNSCRAKKRREAKEKLKNKGDQSTTDYRNLFSYCTYF